MQCPRREQSARDGIGERAVKPRCRGLEEFGTGSHKFATPQLSPRLPAKLQRGFAPEVGAEQPECEIGLGAEVGHRRVPRIGVAQPRELCCGRSGVGGQEPHTVGAHDSGGQGSVDVRESASREIGRERAVRGTAHEQRVPAAQQFDGVAGERVGRGRDRATGFVIAFAQQHPPAVLGQQRSCDQGVDARAHDDGVKALLHDSSALVALARICREDVDRHIRTLSTSRESPWPSRSTSSSSGRGSTACRPQRCWHARAARSWCSSQPTSRAARCAPRR